MLSFSAIEVSGYLAMKNEERGSRLLNADFHGWKSGRPERGFRGHPIVRKANSFFCQVYNIYLLRR